MASIAASNEIVVPLEIGDGIKEVPVRFLYNARIGVIQKGELLGQLVMPVWQRGKGPVFTKDQVVYRLYRDIYWMFRGITHGKDGYRRDRDGEFVRLEEALQASRMLHAELLSITKGEILSAREEELHTLVGSIMMYLNPRVRVDVKREGLEKITAVASFRDSKFRRNVTPLAARMVAVQNRLMIREDGIARIDSVFALRKSILAHVISALDFEVNTAEHYFNQLVVQWESVCSSFEHKVSVINMMSYMADIFSGIDVQPYQTTFAYSAKECQEIESLLCVDKFDEARTIVDRTHSGFLLRQIRSDLELTMLAISRASHFHESDFDFSGARTSIDAALVKLSGCKTETMAAFDPSVVEVYLEQTSEYLRNREVVLAHDSLQQALVLL